MLSTINAHERDKNIVFTEEGHSYTIQGCEKKPISVTSLIHKYFPEFNAETVVKKMMSSANFSKSKYYGKTKEQIKDEWDTNGKDASRLGTLMHKDIENYFNGLPIENPDAREFALFTQFWSDMQLKYPCLKPYRTEWMVYDEDIGLAGSIDFLLTDDDGQIVIIDWKRSHEIKKTNTY